MKRSFYFLFFVAAIKTKMPSQEAFMIANDNSLENYKALLGVLDGLEEIKIKNDEKFIRDKGSFVKIFNENAEKKLFFVNGSITHRKAKNFLRSLDKDKFLKEPEEVKQSLKELPPNEISFVLLYELFSKKEIPNKDFVEYILENCELEFDKEEFNNLPDFEKKALLRNLAFPFKQAKKCYKKWIKAKYDLDIVSHYKSLSPVGVAYFILLIFHSKEALSDADESYVLSDRIYTTLLTVVSDSRFKLGNEFYLMQQNNPFYYFQSKFREKYMDFSYDKK